eukprot:10696022-Heterocapsa_arctica.AAC.1
MMTPTSMREGGWTEENFLPMLMCDLRVPRGVHEFDEEILRIVYVKIDVKVDEQYPHCRVVPSSAWNSTRRARTTRRTT